MPLGPGADFTKCDVYMDSGFFASKHTLQKGVLDLVDWVLF